MRPNDKERGRMPPTLQIVHGYLDEILEQAVVASGVLTWKHATMSVWHFDDLGDWSDTGRNVEVWWRCEDGDLEEATPVTALWSDSLERFIAYPDACGPTNLPLGGS